MFNCDKTGFNFRLLPENTLAASFERSANGRKASKERVIVNACWNATGTMKLPLQVIGKAKHPRCFKIMNMKLLPVEYNGQANEWMTCDIFYAWFHHSFVPITRDKLSKLGLPPKAVLVLDNYPAHPDAEELISDDGNIFAYFLLANFTT